MTDLLYVPHHKLFALLDDITTDATDGSEDLRDSFLAGGMHIMLICQYVGLGKYRRFFQVEIPGELVGPATEEQNLEISTRVGTSPASEKEPHNLIIVKREFGDAKDRDLFDQLYKFVIQLKEFLFMSITPQEFSLEDALGMLTDEDDDHTS